MFFKGTFNHTVDDKGRVFLPAKFREGFADGVVVSQSFFSDCLCVYSNEEFEKLSAKFDELSFLDEDAQDFQRELYAGASDVDVDKQGRILLSASMRQWADIDKEVVIIGSRTHAQIWDKDKWESRMNGGKDMRQMVASLRNQGVKL